MAGQRPVRERRVDPWQILHDRSTGTNRHVADFRIPHLPRGEAYRRSGSLEQPVTTLRRQAVEHWGAGLLDGIALQRGSMPPTVQNAENQRSRPLASIRKQGSGAGSGVGG